MRDHRWNSHWFHNCLAALPVRDLTRQMVSSGNRAVQGWSVCAAQTSKVDKRQQSWICLTSSFIAVEHVIGVNIRLASRSEHMLKKKKTADILLLELI